MFYPPAAELPQNLSVFAFFPSRVHQAVKLYLFSTTSGGFNCPLAMTDGAAKVIEVRAQLASEDTAHVLTVLARARSTGRGSRRADLPSGSGHGLFLLCDSALSPTAWLSPFSAKSVHPD